LFNVIRVEKKRVEGNVRKTFCMFWEILFIQANLSTLSQRVLLWLIHTYFMIAKSFSKDKFSMIKYFIEFSIFYFTLSFKHILRNHISSHVWMPIFLQG
jgi:hypothetical protein